MRISELFFESICPFPVIIFYFHLTFLFPGDLCNDGANMSELLGEEDSAGSVTVSLITVIVSIGVAAAIAQRDL